MSDLWNADTGVAGRYVMLLMAIFSLYTGLLYNEAFSIPMSIFGPGHWACPTNTTLTDRAAMELDPNLCPEAFSEGLTATSNSPYAVGVDPTWHGTRTELQYLNSVKMKLSIILGRDFSAAQRTKPSTELLLCSST